MSFRIGQRVTSHFTGGGTIQSDILPREEPADDKQQIVQFDSAPARHAPMGNNETR